MNLRKYLPDSISALVYKLGSKRILWTLGIWAIDIPTMMGMIHHNPSLEGLAFATGASIAFVGALPLVQHEKNIAHNILGAIGALLSQAWVICTQYPNIEYIVAIWLLYAITIPIIRDKWCFIAEILCIFNILYIII